ncbi:DUF1963 domain-containing protein [Micromonospora sp. NPDC052213]|uniref:DUF1963 domain-containing protein n=1 Tax=Micromonospora sp. NPDC052213 TaxID=3155812 RepID=UPI0034179215
MPLPPASSTLPNPPVNRHLLPEDLDAMLTAAVREAYEKPEADADQLTDRLRALVRPAWLLSRDRDTTGSGPLGGSRIGGLPDLPRGWQWPTTQLTRLPEDGAAATRGALAFTAQINLADVAGAADAGWLPLSGWLWFFRDEEDWSGGSKPNHVVLYADVPVTELHTAHPPADLKYLGDLGSGPERDSPLPVRLNRTLFLTANYKTDWQSRGYDRLAEALDEEFDEDCAGFELFSEIQHRVNRAAVGDKSWEAMLLGRPTPCPPPGGACPCGRSTPSDVPGYDSDEGRPCAWACDSMFVLYDFWGDGPLVFTADARTAPAVQDGRWAGTKAWVY